MKSLFTFLLCWGLCSSALWAQPSALILSSDDGEPLHLFVDGAQINELPATQIFSGPLDPGSHRLRVVVYQGADAIEVKKAGYMEPGMVYYATVMRNKKGEYIMRDYNMVTWDGRNPLDTGQPAPVNPVTTNPNTTTYTETVNPGVTETRTNTTHTTNVNTGFSNTNVREDGDRVNMDVNMMGIRVNVDVNANENGMNMNYRDNMGTTSNTHTTGTTTSTTTTTTTTGTPAPHHGTPHRAGCPAPMSSDALSAALGSIRSKSFEDTRLSVAKQVLNSNCLFSQDIAAICKLFDFEATRLDFAKYAYGRTFDPENYFVVNDVFDFESSITDLTNYIATQRR
ncbi:MAG: DUF4476 domain-containing protein [Bacteroidetes bacterium]|nr:DUF4476 domain-containing protein [Bacteroidota bacterium]